MYCATDCEDAKLQHVAHVMAQYIDNNGDGIADDPSVLRELVKMDATLVMFRYALDFKWAVHSLYDMNR